MHKYNFFHALLRFIRSMLDEEFYEVENKVFLLLKANSEGVIWE